MPETKLVQEPIQLALCLEKIPGQGEDAPPLVEHLSPPDKALILGVFDGLGGAGAQQVTLPTGEQRSGAYVGSRLARQATQAYFAELEATIAADPTELVRGLKERLARTLQSQSGSAVGDSSKLRGTLMAQLPTTLALAYIQKTDTSVAHVLAIWSGDSRVYVLDPQTGMGQLTIDDLQIPGDAYANLTNDSPMSNYVSASRSFRLNYREVDLETPCVVLAATDGCFDYLPTPMHWEYLLLYTLVRAHTVDEWQQELEWRLGEIAADDVSLALVGLGFQSLGELQWALAERVITMKRHYMKPLRQALERDGEIQGAMTVEQTRQQRALGRELWEAYKVGYEWDGPPVEQEG